jgi:hypothetical protein
VFRAEADDLDNHRSAGLKEESLSSQWGEHAKKQAKQVDVAFWQIWANTLIPYSVGMQISIRGRWSHGSYPNRSYGNYEVTSSLKI